MPGGLDVLALDRLEDPLVLVPAGDTAGVDQHREHHLGLVAERRHRGLEVLVLRGPLDQLVEVAVVAGGEHDVVLGGRLAPVLDALAHRHQIVVGAVASGHLGGVRLEHRAQLEQLAGAVGLEPADVGAAAGHDLDQPGALERTQCLANRVAGDAELLGEPVLEQPLAGRQVAGHDHLPDLVGHDFTKRAMRTANGHDNRIRTRFRSRRASREGGRDGTHAV